MLWSVSLPSANVCIAALNGAVTSAYGTRYDRLLAFQDLSSCCCVTGIISDVFSYLGANLFLYASYISSVIPVIFCADSIATGVAIPTVVVKPINCLAPICLTYGLVDCILRSAPLTIWKEFLYISDTKATKLPTNGNFLTFWTIVGIIE